MGERLALSGNEAAAYAMKQINPDVVAAYPITPQTEMMHAFAQYVADGEVDTEMVNVESEHSAMSACIGSAASGARTMTATSANGFALMWEVVYIAASSRLPICMALVNRALSGPINIHCDHSDSMGGRDAGWIQFYCENAQEVYDLFALSPKIAEHPDVQLPVMVCYDGFIISHTVVVVDTLTDAQVQRFIGPYQPRINLLDYKNPFTFGPLDFHDYYFEHKRQQVEAMEHAHKVIPQVFAEYEKLSKRKYSFFEGYQLEDAEIVLLILGSTAGTAKVAVDELRSQGKKVGLLKLTVFRPFPVKELQEALSGRRAVAVLDRCASFGSFGGPVFSELRSALYGLTDEPLIRGYIYGLGGRDMGTALIRQAAEETLETAKKGEPTEEIGYLGVRE